MSPSSDEQREEMTNIPYMQAIGCLLYASQITRPDICFAVNMLSRYCSNPGNAHWNAVKRVFRYLKGSINKGLVYSRNEDDIIRYCDADWASDTISRRSTTGYLFMFQGAAISWSSKLQRTIALSSTEAELMAIVQAIQEVMWLKRFEKELIIGAKDEMLLFCDNKSAMHTATNNSYSARTKHVDIKNKFVRDNLEKGTIKLKYLPTNEMPADAFTKGLSANKTEFFTTKFGLTE